MRQHDGERAAADDARRLRGRRIGVIFQDPLTSLNPLYTIGRQLEETILTHLPLSKRDARVRALSLLREVGIPAPESRYANYPHQFSGGMRQRVVIALALAAEPKLLIADEPTTALDVSVQAQIIALLKRLCRQHGAAVMLITHDMGVIAETADRVAVMYAGRIAEIGPVLVIATIHIATAIITEATLSFLGVGVPATRPSLGTLIRIGNEFLYSGEWWITVFPGVALVTLVLSVNLLGDWLRDALNPRLR